jgi:hypothetical protein
VQNKGRSGSSSSRSQGLPNVPTCKEVISECLAQTGAERLSNRAASVACVALALAGPGQKNTREYRSSVRKEYIRTHECGSIFILFVLPVIIAVISEWIAKWLVGKKASEVVAVTAEASAFTGY